MPDLISHKTLPGTATRQDLGRAGSEMASSLARELGRRRMAYREIHVEAAAEDEVIPSSRLFPRPQGPEKLSWHMSALLAGLPVPGPLTGLTVRLGGLSPAEAAQLTFGGLEKSGQKAGLNRLREEMNQALYSPAVDRREKMLSFYDPFRQKG